MYKYISVIFLIGKTSQIISENRGSTVARTPQGRWELQLYQKTSGNGATADIFPPQG